MKESPGGAIMTRSCLLALLIGGFAWSATTRNGADVTRAKSGTKNDLLAVAFADARTGFAVGAKGTVLKTTDGGATWKKVEVDTDAELCDVAFHGEEIGWIVGTGGTSEQLPQMVRDYWARKRRADMEVLMYLNMGHFLVSRNNPLPHPTVLATTDGGEGWTKKKVLKTNFMPTKVCPVSDKAAWFSTYATDHGDGDLWGTRNGGGSWRCARTWRNVYDFQMIDADNGWAGGEPEGYLGKREPAGGLMRISRGGRYSLVKHDFAAKEAVMALHFVSKERGWVVTEQGSIYHTDDEGESFKRQHGPPPPDTNRGARSMGHVYGKKIKFPYETICFGSDTHGIAGGRAGLLTTIDGGENWTKADLPDKVRIRDVAFTTPTTAVAVADGGAVFRITLGDRREY
jgi:photosystem II stability/assembly factor-like uncharacterized protein